MKNNFLQLRNKHVEIIEQKDMKGVLQAQGREANFTSDVSLIKLNNNNNNKWVLKLCPKDSGPKGLTEIIGEIIAYKFSSTLGINLVPETEIIKCEGLLGTIQQYADDTLPKEQYSDLLKAESEKVQILKLFWFILGQWDTSEDNVLFTKDFQPIAIDNANIGHLQKVEKYGAHPFVRLFYLDKLKESGSLIKPIKIEGSKQDILGELQKSMVALPQSFTKSLSDSISNFSYFVEENRVWRDYNPEIEPPLYFTPKISKNVLDRFNVKSLKSIISDAIGGVLELEYEYAVQDTHFTAKVKQIHGHFELIEGQINARLALAQEYYWKSHSDDQPILGAEGLSSSDLP